MIQEKKNIATWKFISWLWIFLVFSNQLAWGEEIAGMAKEPFEYAVDLLNAVRGEDREEIRSALDRLETLTPPSPEKVAEATAFWVNLYNGLVTWQKFLDPNGVKTASSRKSFFTRPLMRLSGEEWSLDDIEHGILRGNVSLIILKRPQIDSESPKLGFVLKKMDPRIHGALNCGALSCPPINYYDPINLEKQLDTAISNLVMQSEFHPEKSELRVSRIFEWYKEDFKNPPLLEWFDRFLNNEAYKKAREAGKEIKVNFMEYRW